MDVKTSSNFLIGSVMLETGFSNNIKNLIPFLEHSSRNFDCHNLPYPLVDYHNDNVTDVFMFVLSRSAWP